MDNQSPLTRAQAVVHANLRSIKSLGNPSDAMSNMDDKMNKNKDFPQHKKDFHLCRGKNRYVKGIIECCSYQRYCLIHVRYDFTSGKCTVCVTSFNCMEIYGLSQNCQ